MSTMEPMLVSASAVDERLKQMNEAFLASIDGFAPRRRREATDAESSNGSSTARAPSSGPSTIGRRTLNPITFTQRREDPENIPPLLRRPSSESRRGGGGGEFDIPAEYMRPRMLSTSSARSGTSIASGEFFGRMDPEIEDERRRSRSSGYS